MFKSAVAVVRNRAFIRSVRSAPTFTRLQRIRTIEQKGPPQLCLGALCRASNWHGGSGPVGFSTSAKAFITRDTRDPKQEKELQKQKLEANPDKVSTLERQSHF